MVMNSSKYWSEIQEDMYKIDMRLTIRNFSREDNTTYKCVAKNSLGETEGDIRLNGKLTFSYRCMLHEFE